MESETLNRFDRVVALFIHLQSARVVKAQELADRFGVSLRTIYRDIRSLEAAGVPIVGEAGVGYSIMEGYRMPPVMFTREEAGSFVAAEKLMESFSDKKLGSHFAAAMYKMKSVLHGHSKDHIAALESQILINTNEDMFNQKTPDSLEIILDGIAEKKQVSLEYHSAYNDTTMQRHIEPIGVIHENHHWYVIAWCNTRNAYRQFRTDRMLQIKRTDEPFTRMHPPTEEIWESYNEVVKTKVVIRVDKDAVKYIKTGRKYYGFVSERDLGLRVEMTFMTDHRHHGLARWYLMFGDCAEIVEPNSFKDEVLALIEKSKENLSIPEMSK